MISSLTLNLSSKNRKGKIRIIKNKKKLSLLLVILTSIVYKVDWFVLKTHII